MRFLQVAKLVSSWSTDPGRKVGAVIVGRSSEIRSTGFNGVPRNVEEHDHRVLKDEKGTKYLWIEHAERNAIYNAARGGVSVRDCTIYSTLFPCADCARGIIQSGIRKLVCPDHIGSSLDHFSDSWTVSREMLTEAGIELLIFPAEQLHDISIAASENSSAHPNH